MATMYVTHPGHAGTRFDRGYYVSSHLPLVMEAWGRYGLESVAAFFPPGDGAGTIAVCICRSRDEAALRAALALPQSGPLMVDVAKLTPSTCWTEVAMGRDQDGLPVVTPQRRRR